MYKNNDLPGSQQKLQGQPIASFGHSPYFYSDGLVGRINTLPGLGEPTVQLVSPSPNISGLVDYLDATLLARGKVTVPTQKVNFLAKLDPPKQPTWWKRLWKDPLKVFPNVRVTVELVQVGISSIPFPNYATGAPSILLRQGLSEYMMRLQSKDPCSSDFATILGGGFLITAKEEIEKNLGIEGQLDVILKKRNLSWPMSKQDIQRHFWIVYATFPAEIRKYVIPETRIVLDEFKFDNSSLTSTHTSKIIAIARHCEAMAASVSVGTGFTIGLVGHTDDRGTEKYNIDLADRRVSEVKEALRKAIEGIGPGLSTKFNVKTKSFGETKPRVRATTERGHALNRRVELFLPIPRRRCPRVSLRAVVRRAIGLLPRLSSPEQAKRIDCLLRKVIQRGADHRWVDKALANRIFNPNLPPLQLGTYPFILLRDELTLVEAFGASVPDARFLNNLETIDEKIIEGTQEVSRLMELLLNLVSAPIPVLTPNMKPMDALRGWINARMKDDRSIYSCYRG